MFPAMRIRDWIGVLPFGTFAFSVLALVHTVPVFAQEAAPRDPKALMLATSKVNGLIGPDVQPWHIKASFRILDESGLAPDAGTYEEFWAAPTKFKRTFTTSKFSQTSYGTEKGLFRSGQREDVPFLIDTIHRELINPMLNPEFLAHESFMSSSSDLDGEKVDCLMFSAESVPSGRSWCVRSGQLVLRRTSFTGESLQVIHDRSLSFEGRFVAGDLRFLRAGKLALTVHVDSVEALDPQVDIQPSPDALPLRRRINVSAGVAVGMLQHHPAPVYPPGANVSGTVVMHAVIGVDGSVQELSIVSGPSELQQAALNAVRTWTYKPYLLNNEPVEVMTQINVVFKR
jgi:hypothetical protein